MTGSDIRLVVRVRGSVQGVGFRWFVQREAERLGLRGWVSNEPDGSVQVVAEGDDADLDRLLSRLWEGPPGASVVAVAPRREPARADVHGFTIRSGSHPGD